MCRTVRRAFTVVGALLLVMAMALPASAKIEFHRIVYNPSGSDTGTNSHLNREFVVLHNTGSRGPADRQLEDPRPGRAPVHAAGRVSARS